MTVIDTIKKELEKNYLSNPKRLNHIKGVYNKAIKLAEYYNISKDKIEIAALMHDYTKYLPENEQLALMQEANEDLNMSKKLYHGFTASYLAKKIYGINDQEILDAIKYHTTGNYPLTDTLKVLMIADITEENTRDYEMSNDIRKYEYTSLEKAVQVKLEWMIKDSKERNYKLSPLTNKLIKELL